MKLQRYRIRRDGVIEAVDTGEWLQWPDVDALLARIREAVDAERAARVADAGGFHAGTGGNLASVYHAEADLDALLNEGA